jgi:hypothetical protein
VFLTQFCAGGKIEKNGMVVAFSTNVEERGVYRVLVGKPEEKGFWGNPDINGRIIFRWIFRI